MIRVFITDDHAIVRKGLRQIVAEQADMQIVGEAENYADLIRSMRTLEFDVLLLDISMPGKNGMEVLKLIKQQQAHIHVLMLSMYPEDQYAVRALKSGAAGYLNKNSAPEKLVEAIHLVARGKKYITPELAEFLALHVADDTPGLLHEKLSDREFQTIRLIASGKKLSEIADELALSPKTVSVYRARILEKMGLRNNAELTHYALKHSLVE